MSERERLPNRRYSATMDMLHADKAFSVSIGFYANGRPAEVFISGPKVGSDNDAIARDGAVLLSLALQYGIPLSVIQATVTRDQNGKPSTIVGAVVDTLVRGTAEHEHNGLVLVRGATVTVIDEDAKP
jgi:hypothetical protein